MTVVIINLNVYKSCFCEKLPQLITCVYCHSINDLRPFQALLIPPIRRTRSVCPACLRNLPADLVQEESGRILLEKHCPECSSFAFRYGRA